MIRLPVLALAAALLAAPASAQPPADLVAMEVLPGWQTDSGTWMAGIRFRLAPGWKTYWRSPGDAGIPPLFTWAGSENIAATAFHWPVPEVFDQSGMQSIGYSHEVVIPVEITPLTYDAPPRLAGHVEIGICQDICVPVTLEFGANLAPGLARNPAIVAALVDRPLTPAEAGAGAVTCSFAPAAHGLSITAALELPEMGGDEVVVIETADPALYVSEAEVRRDGNLLLAEARVIATRGAPVAIDRAGLRLTVLAEGRAVDIRGCPAG